MLILVRSILKFVYRNLQRENIDERPRSPSSETSREEHGIRNVTLGRDPAVVARVTAHLKRGVAKLTKVTPNVLRRLEKNLGLPRIQVVGRPAAEPERKNSAFVIFLLIIAFIVVNAFYLATGIVPLLLSVGYKF